MQNRKIMQLAEEVLKRTEYYNENCEDGSECNYQLAYVLVKGDEADPDDAIAYAFCGEDIVVFNPLKGPETARFILDWAFSIDTDLLMYLEQGYELAGMSLENHCCIWSYVETYPGDITCNEGMEKYSDYCEQNGITEELLASLFIDDGYANCSEDTAVAITELETSLQKESKIHETMTRVNDYYQKHGTLDGCPYLNKEEITALEADIGTAWHWEDSPYTSFQVERVKSRIGILQDTIKTFKRRLSEFDSEVGGIKLE